MRKIMTFILTLSLLCMPIVAFAGNGDTIVHITKTGEKYHSAGCSYLKSDISISLADAVSRGYTPCSRCYPPLLVVDEPANNESSEQTQMTKEQIDAILYGETVPAQEEEPPSIDEQIPEQDLEEASHATKESSTQATKKRIPGASTKEETDAWLAEYNAGMNGKTGLNLEQRNEITKKVRKHSALNSSYILELTK